MITIKGKYNQANIMLDEVDEGVYKDIKNFLNCKYAESNKPIIIMPDCHSGAGCVIGFTMHMNDYIIPNIVGVDIGCSIVAFNLGKIDLDFKDFDNFLKQNIPTGFNKHKKPVFFEENENENNVFTLYDETIKKHNLNKNDVYCSIGTLGGGNHFIELEKDEKTKDIWLTIHTGSRNFGWMIADFYQKEAKKLDINKDIYKGLEALEVKSFLGEDYLYDAEIAQTYAAFNHYQIANIIIENYFLQDYEKINEVVKSIHNYINFDDKIIRKGAISSYEKEKLIIPLNMRDGIIIGEGLSNPNWNYSAPHGAGRVLSRKQAKNKINLEDFKNSMKGVYSSCICNKTLDESPFAYKDKNVILNNISETVKIERILKPIYNFKAVE